jgi:hypothetical protein
VELLHLKITVNRKTEEFHDWTYEQSNLTWNRVGKEAGDIRREERKRRKWVRHEDIK